MKLKTLKDLKKHYEEYYDEEVINNVHTWKNPKVLISDLKQEAIKWVKEKRSVNNDMEDFMEFHNITGEDLR